MSDFILPGDIERMAQEMARSISEAWAMLEVLCWRKPYPLDVAQAKVNYYINTVQLSEIEAIRKVYNEIVYH